MAWTSSRPRRLRRAATGHRRGVSRRGVMRLLLDTHVLLWWLADDPALSEQARVLIANEPEVFASAASAWEIAIKRALGKLEAPQDLLSALEAGGIQRLPIDFEHATVAGGL